MSDAKPLSRESDRRKLAEVENELRDAKATVRAAEARADAERERADGFRLLVMFHAELQGCDRCAQGLADDDRHRAAQGEGT